MGKYRGKYKKCRECKQVEEIGMGGIWVNDNCPKGLPISGGNYAPKSVCEDCDSFVKKEVIQSET